MQVRQNNLNARRLLGLTDSASKNRPIIDVRDLRTIGFKDRSRSHRRERVSTQRLPRWRNYVREAADTRRQLVAFLRTQESAADVMDDRREAPKPLASSNVVYICDRSAYRTAEEIEAEFGTDEEPIFASRYIDPDSGDLTVEHFAQHSRWTEIGDDADIEDLPGYGNALEGTSYTPSRAPRASCYAIKDDGKPGAKMPIPAQRARWHTHVRTRLPDSDEA